MSNNQPQTNPKNDQPSKPIVVDNKAEAAKTGISAVKPADTTKPGAV